MVPAAIVLCVLIVCAAKGAWFTAGVMLPPDADTVRDLGFIQGVRDGDWFADPITAGAWGWYPPLLHGLAALLSCLLPIPLLDTWLHAGAVLNLASPLAFAWMGWRLVGPWPAAIATVVLVLVFGAMLPGDAGGGYTPWTLSPALTWPLFFVAVRLIAGAVQRLSVMSALLAGSVIGLVFLAHTVPALLLAPMTASAALAVNGCRWRTWRWLAITAPVALAWTLPFLLPLLLAYRLHIVHASPGAWAHPVLSDPLALVPALLGLAALARLLLIPAARDSDSSDRSGRWYKLLSSRVAAPPTPRAYQSALPAAGMTRGWTVLPRVTMALLVGWMLPCLLLLGRHYACDDTSGGVCGVVVIAAHHYVAYLQPAWALLVGVAVLHAAPATSRHSVRAAGGVALALCAAAWFTRPEDLALRRIGGTGPAQVLDRAVYDWLLLRSRPDALVLTDLPANPADMGPRAATVFAAGRNLVASPELHSNPYMPWPPRNAQRLAWLRRGADLCPLLRAAGPGAAYILLASGEPAPAAPSVFASGFNTLYRVPDDACRRFGTP